MPRTTTTKKQPAKRQSAPKKQITSGIIVVDNGGQFTKVITESMTTPIQISSEKAIGHNEFRLDNVYGEDTYKILHNDVYYFMGELIEEGLNTLTSFSTTKTTDYFIVSTLHAIALYGYDNNIVFTNAPYKRYTEKEINGITEKLIGHHNITINEVEYEFDIEEVVVTPEVSMAFFNERPKGKVHWLDFGSRTIGWATTVYKGGFVFRQVEKETGTLEGFGLEQADPQNISAYVSEICGTLLKKWKTDEPVYVIGGGVLEYPEIIDELQNYFSNVIEVEDPHLYQAKGILEFAKEQYADNDEEMEGEED